MDYVARLRVTIGRRLLLETSDTLDKIAARLGFADASNFSRTFKDIDAATVKVPEGPTLTYATMIDSILVRRWKP